MINKEQLSELNKMKCSEHNETPKAKYQGENINFEYCCDEFNHQIKEYVREKTLTNLQKITRKRLGLD